jgi:hypothetical protein
VECMLFEPATTLNTGNVVSDKTVVEVTKRSFFAIYIYK